MLKWYLYLIIWVIIVQFLEIARTPTIMDAYLFIWWILSESANTMNLEWSHRNAPLSVNLSFPVDSEKRMIKSKTCQCYVVLQSLRTLFQKIIWFFYFKSTNYLIWLFSMCNGYIHINFLKQKIISYYGLNLMEFLLLWIWISRHGHGSRKPEWFN